LFATEAFLRMSRPEAPSLKFMKISELAVLREKNICGARPPVSSFFHEANPEQEERQDERRFSES
jgi:hypothetical protein